MLDRLVPRRCSRPLTLATLGLLSLLPVSAATFSGNGSITANDPAGSLSWSATTRALTVSCWFRISIPSGQTISQNMTILVNRQDGDETSPSAYLLRYNVSNGNIEFVSRNGTANTFVGNLVRQPYLERWYHVAVKRAGNTCVGFLDGREVFNEDVSALGNTVATTNGISVGGWNGSRFFWGDVQEVAIYQRALTDAQIFDRMFRDQATSPNLTGYYRLAFTTNETARLNNSAPGATNNAIMKGPVAFEETDHAGEQSLFDARKNSAENAIAPLSGGFFWGQTALARPTPGVAFDLRFAYASANASPGGKLGYLDPYSSPPMGLGWRHSFETRLLPEPLKDEVRLLNWDGSIETWILTNGVYRTRHNEYRGELVETNAYFEWTTPDRLVYRFRGLDQGLVMSGRLDTIRDFNSNRVKINWVETEGTISNVVDSVGGTNLFHYDARGLLTNVSFHEWSVSFSYDTNNNRLISKSLSNSTGLYTNRNTTWQFAYNAANGLLERIIDRRGKTNVLIQYDKYGRVTNQINALGYPTATVYGGNTNRTIRHIDPELREWVATYDRKGRVLSQQDPLTNITSYVYDDRGNRIRVTEPLGWTTTFAYDERANVVARTNALGQITSWVLHTFFNKAIQEVSPQPVGVGGSTTWTNFYVLDDSTGNLLQHYDYLNGASNNLVSYTYATNGLVLTSTDANGTNVTRFTYNTDAFLTARTDPAGFTTYFDYNDVGWKLAETNALRFVTRHAYDINGNIVWTLDPRGRVFTRTYDENGNLTTASDAKNKLTQYAYDDANQKVAMTNRDNTVWTYTYTKRGKLATTASPIHGIVTTNYYDAANRFEHVSDPAGNSIANVYDSNGNPIALVDQLGQFWTKAYDRLNRVVAESDPQGDTKQTTYDASGCVYQILTPKGYPSTHFYDGRGRLTRWIDAEGNAWLYTYDGNGNILDIEDPLHGHYGMVYGPRNERRTEVNQDGKRWGYTYDEVARLKTQTDPNGIIRTTAYDDGGRIESLAFNTGRVNLYSWDNNDNLRVLTRFDNGVKTEATVVYDEMDRVTEYQDPFSKSISYGRDVLGRITTLTYPDGRSLTQDFDVLSRLTHQVFTFSATTSFTNIYAYDKAGRLVRRSYPNGVVQTNGFDISGQLTNLTYSAPTLTKGSIGIALTYAYDRNGNRVRSTETGTLDWQMPSLTDEPADYTPAGRLKARTIGTMSPNAALLRGEGSVGKEAISYAYDSSGNMTSAVRKQGEATTESWTLDYDEDNRTMHISHRLGTLPPQTIVNRYDALGRRVARTTDGTETRFVLDLAGKMERILCDLSSNGAIAAYYVHGPDLTFKVDPTGRLTCYHADAQGNIIALTDAGAINVGRYAYTPYGRALTSTNETPPLQIGPQPYTFVGSQGVMEDLPGLFFMRARYYSADAGVFLSTDPIKHIGPGWRPNAYGYAMGNPLLFSDPAGEIAWANLFSGFARAGLGAIQGAGGALTISAGIGTATAGNTAVPGAAVLLGGGIIVVGANAVAEGTLETTKGIQQMLAALSDESDPELQESVGPLRSVLRGGAEGVGLDSDVADGLLTIAEIASAGVNAKVSVGNRGQLYHGSPRGRVPQSVSAWAFSSRARNNLYRPAIEGGGEFLAERVRDRTPDAAQVATAANRRQERWPSGTTTYSGTTATSTGRTMAGNAQAGTSSRDAFARSMSAIETGTRNVVNTITSAVRNAANSVAQAIGSAVGSVRKWLSRGGR